jgi:hypothetical protein
MIKNWNWRKTNFEDYDYGSQERQNKYHKRYFNQKTAKINNYYNKKSPKFHNYQKSDIPAENQFTPEIENFKPFYPKNYKKSQKQFSDEYTKDEQYIFSPKKNNDFSNYENSINNNNNYENKNENQFQNNDIDDQTSTTPSENIKKNETEEQYQKPKKFGIKSIPHPKRKKGHGSFYIPGKKLQSFKQKKEEEIFIKKERKLSISSNQNNFDSAKHSISTLNTSSSSYKEKDVSHEEKKSNIVIDNQTEENNFNNINNDNKIIKNKFDENLNEIKKYEPLVNPAFENTEILKVNVKLPNNETVVYKLRRFDDLFLTIKLFCEINSIDEKLIKPLIIKSLCTINTIYQIYNSQITSEDVAELKKIKHYNDLEHLDRIER